MTGLKRCAAVQLLPLLLIAELFGVFYRGSPWLGEWSWSIDWANGATMLVGPLVAGAAALDMSRFSRGDVDVLLRSPVNAAFVPWRVIGNSTIVGLGVHALGIFIVLAMNIYVGVRGLPSIVSVPAGALVLLANACLGALLGRKLPQLLAPPLSVLLCFGLTYPWLGGYFPQLLRVGGSTGSLVGLTWGLSYAGLASAAALGIAVAASGTLSRSYAGATQRWPKAMMFAGIVLIVFAYVGASLSKPERLVVSPTFGGLECKDGVPRVCMAAETARKLPALADGVQRLAPRLTAAGAQLPTEFVQAVPNVRLDSRQSAPMFLESQTLNSPKAPLVEAAAVLTVPANCPALTSSQPPPQAYFDARNLLETWLMRPYDTRVDLLPEETVDILFSLSAADQDRWVAATYESMTSCDFDAIGLP